MNVSVIERLHGKIMPVTESGCWIWLGAANKQGYGNAGSEKGNPSRVSLVHRLVYRHMVGPIPKGLELDHKCAVKCCVNPQHLEPVTRSENQSRNTLRRLGRYTNADTSICPTYKPRVTHCRNGHKLTTKNTKVYMKKNTGNIYRVCQICEKARTAAKKKGAAA